MARRSNPLATLEPRYVNLPQQGGALSDSVFLDMAAAVAGLYVQTVGTDRTHPYLVPARAPRGHVSAVNSEDVFYTSTLSGEVWGVPHWVQVGFDAIQVEAAVAHLGLPGLAVRFVADDLVSAVTKVESEWLPLGFGEPLKNDLWRYDPGRTGNDVFADWRLTRVSCLLQPTLPADRAVEIQARIIQLDPGGLSDTTPDTITRLFSVRHRDVITDLVDT